MNGSPVALVNLENDNFFSLRADICVASGALIFIVKRTMCYCKREIEQKND